MRLALVSLLALLGCDHDGPFEGAGEGTFDSNGGWLDADDGVARLEIPAGAIAGKAHVFLRARTIPALGLAGDRAWEVTIVGAALTRPLELVIPCANGVCSGDERLGVVGTAGVIPVVEGTTIEGASFRAPVLADGISGVTRCAHLYCLSGRVVDGRLTLAWKIRAGAEVDVREVARQRHRIAGPDGEDELIAVLDPDAPPASPRALSTPSGAVRLVWEPAVLDGVTWVVERRFCRRVERVVRRGGAGDWDDEPAPGSWYTYEIHRDGGGAKAYAQIRPQAPAGGCAVVPFACELAVPAGGDALMELEVEPPLTRGSYVLGFRDREELRGFARSAGFGPATTPHESSIAVAVEPEARGTRQFWVVATDPATAVSCHAPISVRVIEPAPAKR